MNEEKEKKIEELERLINEYYQKYDELKNSGPDFNINKKCPNILKIQFYDSDKHYLLDESNRSFLNIFLTSIKNDDEQTCVYDSDKKILTLNKDCLNLSELDTLLKLIHYKNLNNSQIKKIDVDSYDYPDQRLLRRLLDDNQNFPTLNEYIRYFFDQLKQSYDQDIVLIIGETGVGKSKIANFLSGKHVKYEKSSNQINYVINENDSIFAVSRTSEATESLTCYPQLANLKDYGFLIVDTPGIGDSTGGKLNWLFEIGIQLIIAACRSIKSILIPIEFDQLKTNRANGFKALLKILSIFFKRSNNSNKCVKFLIVGQPVNFELIDIKEIVNSTINSVNYLNEEQTEICIDSKFMMFLKENFDHLLLVNYLDENRKEILDSIKTISKPFDKSLLSSFDPESIIYFNNQIDTMIKEFKQVFKSRSKLSTTLNEINSKIKETKDSNKKNEDSLGDLENKNPEEQRLILEKMYKERIDNLDLKHSALENEIKNINEEYQMILDEVDKLEKDSRVVVVTKKRGFAKKSIFKTEDTSINFISLDDFNIILNGLGENNEVLTNYYLFNKKYNDCPIPSREESDKWGNLFLSKKSIQSENKTFYQYDISYVPKIHRTIVYEIIFQKENKNIYATKLKIQNEKKNLTELNDLSSTAKNELLKINKLIKTNEQSLKELEISKRNKINIETDIQENNKLLNDLEQELKSLELNFSDNYSKIISNDYYFLFELINFISKLDKDHDYFDHFFTYYSKANDSDLFKYIDLMDKYIESIKFTEFELKKIFNTDDKIEHLYIVIDNEEKWEFISHKSDNLFQLRILIDDTNKSFNSYKLKAITNNNKSLVSFESLNLLNLNDNVYIEKMDEIIFKEDDYFVRIAKQTDFSNFPDVNFLYKEKTSKFNFFHYAIRHKNMQLLKYLLKNYDKYLNTCDIYGRTPFYLCCEDFWKKGIELLAKNSKIDLTICEIQKRKTALMVLYENRKDFNDFWDCCQNWFERLLYSKDKDGNNIVHLAVIENDFELINKLNSNIYRKELFFQNNNKDTILHLGVNSVQILEKLIKVLKKCFHYKNSLVFRDLINIKNKNNQNFYEKAIVENKVEILKYLIDVANELNLNNFYKNAFHSSIQNENTDLLLKIYEKQPNIIFIPLIEPDNKINIDLNDILASIKSLKMKQFIRELLINHYKADLFNQIANNYDTFSNKKEIEDLIDHLFSIDKFIIFIESSNNVSIKEDLKGFGEYIKKQLIKRVNNINISEFDDEINQMINHLNECNASFLHYDLTFKLETDKSNKFFNNLEDFLIINFNYSLRISIDDRKFYFEFKTDIQRDYIEQIKSVVYDKTYKVNRNFALLYLTKFKMDTENLVDEVKVKTLSKLIAVRYHDQIEKMDNENKVIVLAMCVGLQILRSICVNPKAPLKSYVFSMFKNKKLSLNSSILKGLSRDEDNFKESVKFICKLPEIEKKDVEGFKEVLQLKSAKYYNKQTGDYQFYTKEGIFDYKKYGFYLAFETEIEKLKDNGYQRNMMINPSDYLIY